MPLRCTLHFLLKCNWLPQEVSQKQQNKHISAHEEWSTHTTHTDKNTHHAWIWWYKLLFRVYSHVINATDYAMTLLLCTERKSGTVYTIFECVFCFSSSRPVHTVQIEIIAQSSPLSKSHIKAKPFVWNLSRLLSVEMSWFSFLNSLLNTAVTMQRSKRISCPSQTLEL